MAHSNLTGPSYYKRGGIEVWDFIRDQQLNYHLGNAVKYVCRAGYKDSKISDLRKAIHYLQNELENEIISSGTSAGVQERLSYCKLTDSYCEDYATDFDR
jgi:hypothetical protein